MWPKGKDKVKTRKCSSELIFVHKVHAITLISSIPLPEKECCCQPLGTYFKVMRPSVLKILTDDLWPELCRSVLQVPGEKPQSLVLPWMFTNLCAHHAWNLHILKRNDFMFRVKFSQSDKEHLPDSIVLLFNIFFYYPQWSLADSSSSFHCHFQEWETEAQNAYELTETEAVYTGPAWGRTQSSALASCLMFVGCSWECKQLGLWFLYLVLGSSPSVGMSCITSM